MCNFSLQLWTGKSHAVLVNDGHLECEMIFYLNLTENAVYALNILLITVDLDDVQRACFVLR